MRPRPGRPHSEDGSAPATWPSRARTDRARGHVPAPVDGRWRGPLDGAPAELPLTYRPLSRLPASEPEEPLGKEQVHHDEEVDEEGDHLQGGDPGRQLVDLEG